MRHHIPPFLRVSDDVLEGIVQAATQQADGYHDHRSIITLSHVCARVRQIILCRASFWNELCISAKTQPEAVEAVLRRSQSVPLHVSLLGTNTFKRIRDSGHKLETLFESVAERIVKAERLCISELQDIDCEVLSRVCETLDTLPGGADLRSLSIEFSPFKDPILNAVIGVHLASLELTFLQEPLAQTLSKILHLAPNIEVLRVFGLVGSARSHAPLTAEPPAHGACLQILQLDSGAEDGNFDHTIELVQKYSPHVILDGRVVELRDAGNASCIEKMELDRFTDVQSITCNNTSEFTIYYLAGALPTRRPVGRHALAALQRQPGGMELMTRGFDAWLNELTEPESPSREVLCRSSTMARSLNVCNTWPAYTLELFSVLACDAWLMLEHVSLEFCVAFTHDSPSAEWNRPPIGTPRLRTFDIVLQVIPSRTQETPDQDVVRSWADPCIALINAVSPPNTARFTLRAADDGDVGVSAVLAAIRGAFSSDPGRFTD